MAYLCDVRLAIEPRARRTVVLESATTTVNCWWRNGQVLGRWGPAALVGEQLKIVCVTPLAEALDPSHNSKYGLEAWHHLLAFGTFLGSSEHLMEDRPRYIKYEHASEGVLMMPTAAESPLIDVASARPIATYTVPISDDGRDELTRWANRHSALFTTFLSSEALERAAHAELASFDSQHMQTGRAIADRIVKATGESVYLFLTRYWEPTRTTGCPSCGGPWLALEGALVSEGVTLVCHSCRVMTEDATASE